MAKFNCYINSHGSKHYRTTRTKGRDCLTYRKRRKGRKSLGAPLSNARKAELREQFLLQNQKADQLVEYCKGLHSSLERADEQWTKICAGQSCVPKPRGESMGMV
jgi:hypothetical protein